MKVSRSRGSVVRQSMFAGAWIAAFAIGLLLLPSMARADSSVVPRVTIDAPEQTFYNEPFYFSVTFENTGSAPGFGPFVELELPAAFAFDDASFLTTPMVPVLDEPCPPEGEFTNPMTGESRLCTPGTQVLVFELPFGSFVPGQPGATIDITATVTGTEPGVVGVPQEIRAVGGYAYGSAATGNEPLYGDDGDYDDITPSVIGTADVTPMIVLLEKIYLGPEDETATGPNFPRVYRINADIADGQTITNFQILDQLPDNLAFLRIVDASPAGWSAVTEPAEGTRGAEVAVQWPSATGALGAEDAWVEIEFYAPLLDLGEENVLDPVTGAFVNTLNVADATGTWTGNNSPIPPFPAPPADACLAPPGDDPLPDWAHCLELQSIAIQKSVDVYAANGETTDIDVRPGRYLRWELEIQVSDFFAFDEVVVEDTYSDGHTFVTTGGPAFAPTLVWANGDGSTGSETFTPATFTHVPDESAGGGDLTFRVSELMGGSGRLIGGCVSPDGDGLLLPCDHEPGNQHDGPTTATIVFWTFIEENWTPTGRGPIVQGDDLSNDVDIYGDVLNLTDWAPSYPRRSDDSAAGVAIETGTVRKSVYAINETVLVPGDPTPRMQPGDRVTYRLQYDMPITRFKDFRLIDYLPLPVFDVDDYASWTFVSETPAAGQWAVGPADTFWQSTIPALNPATRVQVTPISAQNVLQFSFGDYDSPPPHDPSMIDILFTVTVRNDPFVDGLYLTNQVRAIEHNTEQTPTPNDAIVQIQLAQPVLEIVKGVIDVPAHADPAGCAIEQQQGQEPELPTLPIAPLTVLSNNGFDHTHAWLDCDAIGLDAGDAITYAVTIANVGHFEARSVHLSDVLPEGITPGSIVSVTDGNNPSNEIDYSSTTDGNSWTIVFDDPIPAASPSDGTPANGDHIRVITFNATVDEDIAAGGQSLVNEATVLYANVPGLDPDDPEDEELFHPEETDTASVLLRSPGITKTLVETSEEHTAGTNVAIGEVVTYEVVVTVPEGVFADASIVDTLPTGLSFFEGATCTIVDIDEDLQFDPAITENTNCEVDPTSPLTIALGTITNPDTAGTESRTFTIRYDALVENISANQAGNQRQNSAAFWFDVDDDTRTSVAAAEQVRIVEPALTVEKSFSPTEADAGDPVTITLTVRNTGGTYGSDAFDVTLTDVLHDDLVVSDDPETWLACPEGTCAWESEGRTVSAGWDRLNVGDAVTVTIQATVREGVATASVIPNTASIEWTSLPGLRGTDNATPGDSGSSTGERTGTGGVNDHNHSDSADLQIFGFGPQKALIATSEAHTADSAVAIGEVATYRLQIRIAEGETSNVVVTDHMASGLELIGTPRVGFLSASGTALTSNASGLTGCGITAIGGTLPCEITPAGPTTHDGHRDYAFDLGTMTNDAADAAAELVVIEFDALTRNIMSNVSGSTLPNYFTVTSSNGDGTSNTVTTTVVEPLVEITKSITDIPANPDAGDVVTFEVEVRNTGTATAFDVAINDVLPAGLTLNPGSVSIDETHPDCTGGGTFSATDTSSGNTLSVDLSCLNTGAPAPTVTIEYTATIVSTIAANSLIENTATVDYTSLPGSRGTDNATPGEPDTETGERVYDGEDDASFTTAGPSLDKQGPSQPTATIGEQVTYDIVVTLPEGTTNDLVIEELLPSGMGFVGAQLVTTGYAGSVTMGTPDESETGVVAFDLGSPVTTADNNAGNNSFTIRVTLQVLNVAQNQDGEVRVNRATGSWNDGENEFLEASADELEIVEPQLEITKQQALLGDSAEAGQQVQYTLTVQHRTDSSADAYDVTVSDAMPAALAITGTPVVAGDCADGVTAGGTADELVVSIDELPQDCVVTITYVATIQNVATPGLLVINDASVDWASLPDSDGSEDSGRTGGRDPEHNDYDDEDSTVFAIAGEISISKRIEGSDNADTTPHNGLTADAAIGETLTFELAVTVIEGTTTGIVVNDVLPAGLALVDGTVAVDDSGFGGNIGAAWTCTVCTGDTIEVGIAEVLNPADGNPNNNSFIVRFDAVVLNVEGNVAGAELVNDASVQRDPGEEEGDDPIVASSNDVVVTIVEPVLEIAKTFVNIEQPSQSPVEAHANQQIEIRLVVENTGDGPAYDAVVSDALSQSLTNPTLVSVTPESSGFAYAYDEGTHTVTFSNGTLMPGGSATLTFRVTLHPDTPASVPPGTTSIDNEAVIDGTSMPGTPPQERPHGPVEDDDSLIVRAPDLWVTKVDDVADDELTVPGGVVIYTIEYGNTGDELAPGVVLTETVPEHTTFTPTFSDAWVCADGGVAGSTCTLEVGDLAPDATSSAAFAVQVDETVPSGVESILNAVVVGDDGSRGNDRDPSDNEDEEETPLDAAPVLEITKDDADLIAWPGGTIVYTISYANTGNQDATGVVITETVPADTTFLPDASANTGWICDAETAGSACTYEVGDLAAGASGTVTFAVRVNEGQPALMDPVENVVRIADDGENTGGDPVTDEDDEDTPVRLVDLAVTKTVTPSTVVIGQTVTYTIVVTNLGPSDATGVVLEDVLPAGVGYVSHSGDGVYAAPVWTVGDLPAGAARTLNIVVQTTATGTQVNSVRVTEVNEHDPNPENDEDDATVIVTDPPPSPTPTPPGTSPTPTPTATASPSPTVSPTAPPSGPPSGPPAGPPAGSPTPDATQGPGVDDDDDRDDDDGSGPGVPPPASTGMNFLAGSETAVTTLPLAAALVALFANWVAHRWRHAGRRE